MSDTSSRIWLFRKDWWIDHWVDVFGALVIPLMLYMIDCNGKAADELLVRKQIDLQQQTKNEAAAEADNHQAIALLADLSTRIGNEQLPERRAVARAILEYANQGRLYHPSTSVAIDYVARECDQETYDSLVEAVMQATAHTPKNANIPSCEELDDDAVRACLKRKKDAQVSVEADKKSDTKRLTDLLPQRTKACGRVNQGGPQTGPEPLPMARFFRQYLDVGCGEANSGTVSVPLPQPGGPLAMSIVGQPAAHFEGMSNIKDAKADSPKVVADAISVPYTIHGLDRGVLGDCPGGGHATLVVDYQLAPQTATSDAQSTPAKMQPTPRQHSVEKK